MIINSLSALPSATAVQQTTQAQRPDQATAAEKAQGPSFAERVGNAVNNVAETQNAAAASAKAYETGKTDDLAAVMVEQQVASLGFQLTLNVRNKALNAYRDIMNMPV